jgi:hypothetical protein
MVNEAINHAESKVSIEHLARLVFVFGLKKAESWKMKTS